MIDVFKSHKLKVTCVMSHEQCVHINAYSMQMEGFKWVHMAPPSLHTCMLNEAQGCGTKLHKEISCAVNYNYITSCLTCNKYILY